MAHSNVNSATTKPTEASLSDLTVGQFIDLFCWILSATEGTEQPEIFTIPVNCDELILANKNDYDYVSIWIRDGFPVAAGMPMDNFYRVISR